MQKQKNTGGHVASWSALDSRMRLIARQMVLELGNMQTNGSKLDFQKILKGS
jgi:hypothetical protein